MFEGECTQCPGRLVLDTLVSAMAYNKDTSLIIDEEGELMPDNAPDYLVLKCHRCGNTIKQSFEETINEFKLSALRVISEVRNVEAYENMDKTSLREESGMSYCGICPGPFEGDGYCLNDIKDRCIVREAYLDK